MASDKRPSPAGCLALLGDGRPLPRGEVKKEGAQLCAPTEEGERAKGREFGAGRRSYPFSSSSSALASFRSAVSKPSVNQA